MTAEGGGLLAMAGAATFWRGVDASRGLLGCWPWRGSRDRQGYGRLVVVVAGRRRWIRAHRVALAIALGRELAPEELALHGCHRPACVNALHLRPGTPADNGADRRRRRLARLQPTAPSTRVVELAELLTGERVDSSLSRDVRQAPTNRLSDETEHGPGEVSPLRSVTRQPGQSRSAPTPNQASTDQHGPTTGWAVAGPPKVGAPAPLARAEQPTIAGEQGAPRKISRAMVRGGREPGQSLPEIEPVEVGP